MLHKFIAEWPSLSLVNSAILREWTLFLWCSLLFLYQCGQFYSLISSFAQKVSISVLLCPLWHFLALKCFGSICRFVLRIVLLFGQLSFSLVQLRLSVQGLCQFFRRVHWFLTNNLVVYCQFCVVVASASTSHVGQFIPEVFDSIIGVAQSARLDGWRWPSQMLFAAKHFEVLILKCVYRLWPFIATQINLYWHSQDAQSLIYFTRPETKSAETFLRFAYALLYEICCSHLSLISCYRFVSLSPLVLWASEKERLQSSLSFWSPFQFLFEAILVAWIFYH